MASGVKPGRYLLARWCGDPGRFVFLGCCGVWVDHPDRSVRWYCRNAAEIFRTNNEECSECNPIAVFTAVEACRWVNKFNKRAVIQNGRNVTAGTKKCVS